MKPVLMGAAMAAMLLWMLHDRLMVGVDLIGPAVLVIWAHVAVVAGLAMGGLLLARRWPAVLDRLHRPSLRHVARMGGAAAVTAATIHMALHGGLA